MRKILITLFALSFFVSFSFAQVEPSTENNITTYPNPTIEGFYVNAGDEPVTVNMFSLGGKLVLSKVVKGTEYIDVNGIPKGTYIVKLTQNGNTATKKLIIK